MIKSRGEVPSPTKSMDLENISDSTHAGRLGLMFQHWGPVVPCYSGLVLLRVNRATPGSTRNQIQGLRHTKQMHLQLISLAQVNYM